MADTGIRATARVLVCVEVETAQPWGEDCAMSQVFAQASSEVAESVNILLRGKGRIVSTEVTAVLVKKAPT